MKKYNVIVVETGEVVCNKCTHSEAVHCLLELNRIDKVDGTYEKEFYKIKEA